MTEFHDAVGARVGQPSEGIKEVLEQAGIILQPTVPAPRSLEVRRVAFRGCKTLPDEAPERFSYDRDVSAGLWAIVSSQNLAGKSTILYVIRWALTGRSKLRADVRSWIEEVTVEGVVAGRPFEVHFTDTEDGPSGHLTCVGQAVGTFSTEAGFESLAGVFFSDALGLDPTPWWQSRPGGSEGEGDPRRIGWQGYFPALHVRSTSGPLLGEQTMGGQPGTLLQVFLGLPWSLTTSTARVALSLVRRDLSAARRRNRDDAEARKATRGPLRHRLTSAQSALANLRAARQPLSPSELDAHVAAFQSTAAAVTDITVTLQASRSELADAQAEADTAQRLALAMKESAAVRPLLGRLEPSQCPRCTHGLVDHRLARESDGRCFVCDTPFVPGPTDEDAVEAAAYEAGAAAEACEALATQVRQLEEALAATVVEHETSRQAVDEAERSKPAAAAEQDLLREIAIVEALIEQDKTMQREAAGTSDLERRETILAAAGQEASDRRGKAAATFRKRLGDEVVALGRRFGITNLTAADPKLNASLTVTIGGQESNFGSLTGGEQLRLRLAVLVGLLRIGEAEGIGRFPGLLLVDSPNSEEMVEHDAGEILHQLAAVCQELPALQMFLASAKPDLVADVLNEDHMLGAADKGYVF